MPIIAPWEAGGGEAWDHIVIAGIRFTGIVTIDGEGMKKRIARRRGAPGANGARLVDRGQEPAEMTITFKCWLSEHRDQLVRINDAVGPRTLQRATAADAIEIAHPALAFFGITQVYAERQGFPKPDGHYLTQEIKLLEYRPPPPRAPSVTHAPAPAPESPTVDPRIEAILRANPVDASATPPSREPSASLP